MPAANDPNRSQVERAFAELGALADELTVVGGCAAGLLITDPAAPAVRATLDVDLVVAAAGYVEYSRVCDRLARLGFLQATGNQICRWRKADLVLDVMPLDESTLGFGNRWYRSALAHRQSRRLPSGRSIHHIDGPHFLVTKLAAFESRGGGDVLLSHDLEDIVRVVDGRPNLVAEVKTAPQDVRSFASKGLSAVTADPYFQEAMPEFFGKGPAAVARAHLVEGRLSAMIAS